MTIELTPIKDTKVNDWVIESKKMDLEAGYIGEIFGTKPIPPTNIASISVILLVISGIIISIFDLNTKMDPSKYWETVTSVITLALGFIFGKGLKE